MAGDVRQPLDHPAAGLPQPGGQVAAVGGAGQEEHGHVRAETEQSQRPPDVVRPRFVRLDELLVVALDLPVGRQRAVASAQDPRAVAGQRLG